MQRYFGYVFILLAACCWALLGILSKYCLEDGVSPLEVAFWRMFLASLLFLAHAKATDSCQILSWRDAVAFFLFGAVGVGGFFSTVFWSVQLGGAALTAVLTYTAPAWVAILALVFCKEKLTFAKVIAIILSLIGVAFVSIQEGESVQKISSLSIAVGVFAGFLYATHFIFSKQYLAHYTPYALYGFLTFSGSLVLLPFVSFAEKSFFNWQMLGALAFISTYFAYWMYCEGLKRLEATRASITASIEPVIATIIAGVVWGEAFTTQGWIGMALILSAVIVAAVWQPKKVAN